MGCGVTHTGSRLAADQHGGGSLHHRIRWADANAVVTHHRRRQTSNQHSGTAGPHNRTSHMGDRRCAWNLHRAGVKIRDPGGWWHVVTVARDATRPAHLSPHPDIAENGCSALGWRIASQRVAPEKPKPTSNLAFTPLPGEGQRRDGQRKGKGDPRGGSLKVLTVQSTTRRCPHSVLWRRLQRELGCAFIGEGLHAQRRLLERSEEATKQPAFAGDSHTQAANTVRSRP